MGLGTMSSRLPLEQTWRTFTRSSLGSPGGLCGRAVGLRDHPGPTAALVPSAVQYPISGLCFGARLLLVPSQGTEELLSHDTAGCPRCPSLPSPSKSLALSLRSPAPRRIHFLELSPIRDNYIVVKTTVQIMKAVGLLTEK